MTGEEEALRMTGEEEALRMTGGGGGPQDDKKKWLYGWRRL